MRLLIFLLICSISIPLGIAELPPVTAFLSSQPYSGNGPDKCIDGVTDGPDTPPGDMCHTGDDPAPWFALDFGYETRVSVDKVLIYNRIHSPSSASRTKNVDVRLSDELPTSATSMYTGGFLLGSFAGPGTSGQLIEIGSGHGWPIKYGRYVIVQMNNGGEPLNLKEVVAFGISHSMKGTTRIIQIKQGPAGKSNYSNNSRMHHRAIY